MNVLNLLKSLLPWWKPGARNHATPPSGTPSPGGTAVHGKPRQEETRRCRIAELVNGSADVSKEVVENDGTVLGVEITQTLIRTGNDTLVPANDIKSMCGMCGLPSERKDHCHGCSLALCIRHLYCVREPDTGEVRQFCPSCRDRFYAGWNTRRGRLGSPFSITVLERGKSA